MSTAPVTLAVVVPATDGPATLDRCLAAITAAADPPEEIVVVREPVGVSAAEARNRGSRGASADVLMFVDSDVLVHPDAFTRARAAFADRELVAIFGSYDDNVATSGTVAGFRNLLHHVVHQRSAGHINSFWTGIGAVRRSTFEETGGFDPELYALEDVELGGRLARHGRIVLDPALQGTHLKEWSLRSMVYADFHLRGVPWVALLVAERKLPSHLNLGARERASAVAALILALGILRRRPLLAAAGLGTEVALNRDLFALLHARLGLSGALAGVGLHTLHQLTAAASVPAGLLAAAMGPRVKGRSRPRRRP